MSNRSVGDAPSRNGAGARPAGRAEAFSLLKRPFAAEAVSFMATGSYERGQKRIAMVVPFIARAAVEERLDYAFGPDGWSVSYEQSDGAVLCTLSVAGVAKQSFGEGASPWSQEANAFKRAARLFGVGRYLTLWRVARIEVGEGAGQVRARGKSLVIYDELETQLREAYAKRLERSFTERFGEPIDHFAGTGVVADDDQRVEGQAATGAANGGGMVATSTGPRADAGQAPAAPERLGALRSVAADAGYEERTLSALASVVAAEHQLDRLSAAQLEAVAIAVETARSGRVTERGLRQRCRRAQQAIEERPGEAGEIRATFSGRLAAAAEAAAQVGVGS